MYCSGHDDKQQINFILVAYKLQEYVGSLSVEL